MRNIEAIEHEVVQLNGKEVILTIPVGLGRANMSLGGTLGVVQNKDFVCGFHLANPIAGIALVFFADDVESLQAPTTGNEVFAKVINLTKRSV